MSELVVYGIPGSPYFRSALLGFEEKGLPYRLSPLPMGTLRSPDHLRRHPFGRIPVLEHGDFRLYEAQAILRYLDSLSPDSPLQPQNPQAAARMNQIVGIVDWYLFPQVTVPIVAERLMSQQFWNRGPNEQTIANALPNARVCLGELERLQGSAPFLTGESVSIADLMAVPQLTLLRLTPEGQTLFKGTHLEAWLDRMADRPSMRATERERLVKAA
jgi:glutathione S-transferase